MSKLANQPAFPTQSDFHKTGIAPRDGITLRQYYAGLALAGLLSDNKTITQSVNEARDLNGDTSGLNIIATLAVTAADALLTELEKTT